MSLLRWLQDIDFGRKILDKGVLTHFTNIVGGCALHYERFHSARTDGTFRHTHTHIYVCVKSHFFVRNFSLPLFAPIYIYIYIYIIHFHLHLSVNIYSNWLQEQFCNLFLYTLYILYVQ